MSIEPDIVVPDETPLVQPASNTFSQSNASSGPVPGPSNSKPPKVGFFQSLKSAYDVDTSDVLERCLLSVNPSFSSKPYLTNGIVDAEHAVPSTSVMSGKNPDLWGPIWIYFTLVFAVFFAATTSGLYNQVLNETDIQLLTAASGTLFMFTFVAPVCEWLIIHYMDLVLSLTLLQMISLFGYSCTIWVPAVILAGSPLGARAWVGNTAATIIRSFAIFVAFLISAKFVYGNLFKVMTLHASSSVDIKRGKVTMFTVAGVLLHAGLAAAVLVLISIASDDMKSV